MRINFRVSEEEHHAIKIKAIESFKNINEYVRENIFNYKIKKISLEDIKEKTESLNVIGERINDIALSVNSSNYITKASVELVDLQIDECIKIMTEILKDIKEQINGAK